MAVRAEISGVGRAGGLRPCSRCRASSADRALRGDRERACDKGCRDQTPHDAFLLDDPDVRDY